MQLPDEAQVSRIEASAVEIVTPADSFRRKVMNWGVFPAVTTVMVAILLVSIYLANLSLTQPERFEQLTGQPTAIGGLLGQSK